MVVKSEAVAEEKEGFCPSGDIPRDGASPVEESWEMLICSCGRHWWMWFGKPQDQLLGGGWWESPVWKSLGKSCWALSCPPGTPRAPWQHSCSPGGAGVRIILHVPQLCDTARAAGEAAGDCPWASCPPTNQFLLSWQWPSTFKWVLRCPVQILPKFQFHALPQQPNLGFFL